MFGDIPVCPKSVSSGFNPLNLFDFYSRKIALAGTRTSKGTSHPMTCGGCYHAQVMAGGESQLSVVIAGRVPLDFSEDGKRKLSAVARCKDRSWRTLRSGYSGKFVICGDYLVFKEPAHRSGLNCYRHDAEKKQFACSSLYRP